MNTNKKTISKRTEDNINKISLLFAEIIRSKLTRGKVSPEDIKYLANALKDVRAKMKKLEGRD